ncbi:hypothetical protein AR158_C505R [Paramecium bursaria Chlorella virus AR158]|uniref:hypothetical protein n=1 Tax=Paramecium bursaria Chlorella virus AR158 TaxID=380598 RepID=UPI00015AA727|nr:hypothetical protein AR158_C505R [Paramecium bursaria Chlorella virus AR158]ABU44050.1 hypothetical protein AR158_C505R [Paramecium bursaria Chlorella virus AR158]
MIGYPFNVPSCDTSRTFSAYFVILLTRFLFDISHRPFQLLIKDLGHSFHISPGRSSNILYEKPCCLC